MIGMILVSCVLALDQFFSNHALLFTLGLYLFMQSLLMLMDWLYFKSYRNKLLKG